MPSLTRSLSTGASPRFLDVVEPQTRLERLPHDLQDEIMHRAGAAARSHLAQTSRAWRDQLAGPSRLHNGLTPPAQIRSLIERNDALALRRYLAEAFANEAARVDALNAPFDDSLTPLSLGAKLGHHGACQVLFCHGARPDREDSIRRRPAHWAAAHGHIGLSAYLAGAERAAACSREAEPVCVFQALQKGHVAAVADVLHTDSRRHVPRHSVASLCANLVRHDATAEKLTRAVLAYYSTQAFSEVARASLCRSACARLHRPTAYLRFLEEVDLMPRGDWLRGHEKQVVAAACHLDETKAVAARYGMDLAAPDLLHFAMDRSAAGVAWILRAGDPQRQLEQRRRGRTPLEVAVDANDAVVVRMLIAAGAPRPSRLGLSFQGSKPTHCFDLVKGYTTTPEVILALLDAYPWPAQALRACLDSWARGPHLDAAGNRVREQLTARLAALPNRWRSIWPQLKQVIASRDTQPLFWGQP